MLRNVKHGSSRLESAWCLLSDYVAFVMLSLVSELLLLMLLKRVDNSLVQVNLLEIIFVVFL